MPENRIVCTLSQLIQVINTHNLLQKRIILEIFYLDKQFTY